MNTTTTTEADPVFPTANLDPLERYHRRMRTLHRQQILAMSVTNELYRRHNWRTEFRAQWGFR